MRTLLFLLALSAEPVGAEVVDHTQLLGIYAGSSLSEAAKGLGKGGYELSDGTPLSFRDWYTPHFPELTVHLFTEVSRGFGIIWGASTGERGDKYNIAPAFHLGFIAQRELGDNATVSLSFKTVLGGNLKEKACSADYGPFGVSMVNCRLAASDVPPEETLDFLLDLSGAESSRATLRFDYRF